MVLSNKKLKQKLRSLLADSLTSTESHQATATATSAAAGDVKQQLQTVRDLLTSKTQKPKTPRRSKRRKTPPLPEEEDTQNDRKKRKMDVDGGQELTEEDEEEEEEEEEEEDDTRDRKKEKLEKFKMKRKKLQKRKQKLKEKKEKKERLVEKGDVETDEKPEAESIKVDESEVDTKKIYVGGIPYYSSEDDIRSFFEGCGTVTEVDCIMFPETGKFRGIAMLTFKTEAAAQRALALDGADMGGFYLKIQPYKASRSEKSDFAPEVVEGYNRIYIGNLSWDVTEDDVKNLFCDCKVSSIRFGTDKETGEFKGYAHVDFSDSQSLEVALKLDQNEVCGRPAKIRCAVPTKAVVKKAKETVITGKSKKKKRLECFSCGVWGHVASACLRKSTAVVGGESVEASLSSKSTAKQAEDGTGTEDTKIKRRTCYECGVPGHLSSACPKKGAVETGGTSLNSMPTTTKIEDGTTNGNTKKKRQTCYECGVPGHLSSACPKKAVKTDGISLNSMPTTTKIEDGMINGNTKKKRQTCYECGVPGHLSSACPKKGAVEVSGAHTVESSLSLKPTAKKAEDETVTGKVKKKRQTCYECGVPGHISSACPKKSTVEGGSGAVETSLSLNPTAKKAEAPSTGKTKKKRQTCYECGIPGHISSSCPKKGTVEVDGRNGAS